MIFICIRKRPLLKGETEDIIKITENKLVLFQSKIRVNMRNYIQKYEYKYNYLFSETSSNEEIYIKLIEPKLSNIFTTKLLVCTYGDTGTGKTYTLLSKNGLISQTLSDIISKNYDLEITSYEIYNNIIYDILNNKVKCNIREDYNGNIQVCNLNVFRLSSKNSVSEFMRVIDSNRRIGVSSKNDKSSRSHLIVNIKILGRKIGNICFIDFAGSERASSKHISSKKTCKERCLINVSLLSFKECIRAMYHNKSYIPFRRSSLTKVLRNYFIIDSNIIIIGNISPDGDSHRASLNTLNYTTLLLKINHKKVSSSISPQKKNLSKNNIEYFKLNSQKDKTRRNPQISKNNYLDTTKLSTGEFKDFDKSNLICILNIFLKHRKYMINDYSYIINNIKNKKDKKYWTTLKKTIISDLKKLRNFKSIIDKM